MELVDPVKQRGEDAAAGVVDRGGADGERAVVDELEERFVTGGVAGIGGGEEILEQGEVVLVPEGGLDGGLSRNDAVECDARA